jgi:hypothetical protein
MLEGNAKYNALSRTLLTGRAFIFSLRKRNA